MINLTTLAQLFNPSLLVVLLTTLITCWTAELLDRLDGEWNLVKISKYGFCLTSGNKHEYYPNKKTPTSELKKYLGTKNSYTKEVPEIIFNSNRKDISDFLGAYFSCYGRDVRRRSGRLG